MENKGYLKRAWSELTAEQGWWKPMFILALVVFIPVVGTFVAMGYLLDWGREAAWGMTRPPRRKADQIGRWLKWGFFAWIFMVVWALPFNLIDVLFGGGTTMLGNLISLACALCQIVACVLATVASVNMAIYDRFKAGFQVKRVWGMAKKDAGGLVRCVGIELLQLVPFIVLCIILIGPLMAMAGTSGSYMYGNTMLYGAVNVNATTGALASLGALGSWAIFALVVLYALSVCIAICQALAYRAYGYWVAQFQPAKWGGIDAAMPHEPGYVPPAASTGTAAANASCGSAGQSSATTFGDVAESAAAAAATAGAFVKERAEHAADAAKTAAEGFKAEHVDVDADKPVEAEVVAVENEAAGSLEQVASNLEDTSKAAADAQATCPSCGAQVEPQHKFCTNCGAKL